MAERVERPLCRRRALWNATPTRSTSSAAKQRKWGSTKGKLVDFRVTDDCHGQHSHRHVNHIIMSTTSSSSSRGSVTGRERVNSGLRALSGAKPYVFSGKMVFRGRRGGPRSAKVVDNKSQDCIARARFTQKSQKIDSAEALLEDGVGKMHARLWRELGFT